MDKEKNPPSTTKYFSPYIEKFDKNYLKISQNLAKESQISAFYHLEAQSCGKVKEFLECKKQNKQGEFCPFPVREEADCYYDTIDFYQGQVKVYTERCLHDCYNQKLNHEEDEECQFQCAKKFGYLGYQF